MSSLLEDIDKKLEKTSRALHEAVAQSTGQQGASADDPNVPPKKPGTARGIETMFRSAYRVQMDLTGLADNKANMMISINGIIISIIIASVAPKLDTNPWLLIPTTVFLLGNLVSIVYAIMAARPRVSTVPITLQDLRDTARATFSSSATSPTSHRTISWKACSICSRSATCSTRP